jgi:hypothetical protein
MQTDFQFVRRPLTGLEPSADSPTTSPVLSLSMSAQHARPDTVQHDGAPLMVSVAPGVVGLVPRSSGKSAPVLGSRHVMQYANPAGWRVVTQPSCRATAPYLASRCLAPTRQRRNTPGPDERGPSCRVGHRCATAAATASLRAAPGCSPCRNEDARAARQIGPLWKSVKCRRPCALSIHNRWILARCSRPLEPRPPA